MSHVLRIALVSLALHLLPMKPAHADLFAAFVDGVPVAPHQLVNVPNGGRWAFVHVPGEDLFYQFYVSPPVAPPPPKTFRIQDPTGRVTELGDGTRFKAEQKGGEVFIRYRDGETVRTPGKLIKPGEPDPAPPGPQKGVMDGPRDDQAPALALAQVTRLLAQPELADLFPTPIDLSYFKYDFFGADPFPAFRGSITFTTDTGLSSTLAVIPAPGTLALAAAGALAWLLALASLARRGKG